MQRATLLIFVVLAIGCATREHIPRRNLVRPTIDDFRAHITYPYHASPERTAQLERAARTLRKGMTEAEVLRIAGAADYKARWFYPPDTLRGEVWHYVHTWDRPIEPDYHGKMLTVTLDERGRPRILLDFDATDFGVKPHE